MPNIQNTTNFDQKKDIQADNYRYNECASSYMRDRGLLVIPIAGPEGTPPLIIKVHSSYGFRTEKFDIAKNNTQPVIPSPQDTTTTGDILLTADLNLMQPRIRDQQNNLEYAISGFYTYVQASVRGTESTYPTQNYVHVTPEMNPKFDVEQKGFYSDPSFLGTGISGVIGGALAAVQAIKALTPEAVINNIANTGLNKNPNFTVQTTTYFPTFFKPDAIV